MAKSPTQTDESEAIVRQSISGAAGKAEPVTPQAEDEWTPAISAARAREREIAAERARLLGSKS